MNTHIEEARREHRHTLALAESAQRRIPELEKIIADLTKEMTDRLPKRIAELTKELATCKATVVKASKVVVSSEDLNNNMDQIEKIAAKIAKLMKQKEALES